MPTKQVKFNKYKHKNHPWITYGTIESIKHKDTLYKVLCALTSRSPRYEEAEAHFKMYCAKLQKSIRKAKRDHYKEDFEKSKDNTKKTWDKINTLLNKRAKESTFPTHLLKNGKIVRRDKEIAECFNDFFINIGPKLAREIKTNTEKHKLQLQLSFCRS